MPHIPHAVLHGRASAGGAGATAAARALSRSTGSSFAAAAEGAGGGAAGAAPASTATPPLSGAAAAAAAGQGRRGERGAAPAAARARRAAWVPSARRAAPPLPLSRAPTRPGVITAYELCAGLGSGFLALASAGLLSIGACEVLHSAASLRDALIAAARSVPASLRHGFITVANMLAQLRVAPQMGRWVVLPSCCCCSE